LQVWRLQHLCTQALLPSVVLMQEHCFVVFVHATTHPGLVSAGHVGAASASRVAAPSPATPNSAAPTNLSARRLVMVPLANPIAKSSKVRPDVVASSSISSSPPMRRAGPFGVMKSYSLMNRRLIIGQYLRSGTPADTPIQGSLPSAMPCAASVWCFALRPILPGAPDPLGPRLSRILDLDFREHLFLETVWKLGWRGVNEARSASVQRENTISSPLYVGL
jgi:hypothetical protein